MGITFHLIDSDFQANSMCLAVSHAPGSHTAEFIKTELEKVKKEWGLEGRRIHFVTDSGEGHVPAGRHDMVGMFYAQPAACCQWRHNNKQVTDLLKMLASARADYR